MKLSENCLFSLMRRRNITSEMGFLRSPKQLHQLLSWVLMCQLSFSIRILGKTSFSENFKLLSSVISTLNSFRKWFLGFFTKVSFGRCKTICFADAQPVQKKSLCRAIKAYLFVNAVTILAITHSVESKKVKPSFSNWISEGTTFLKSNSMFDIARWTFTCFRA